MLVQLMELSLQFCIYTEGANLRHTPHLLCLVYYIMRSSTAFQEVSSAADPPPAGGTLGGGFSSLVNLSR